MNALSCRFCDTSLQHSFADLGSTPLANSYIPVGQANAMEPTYPLHAYVCHRCFLVQLGEFESPHRIFSDYAYFSSYSDSWLEHARRYVDTMVERFALNASHQVVEVASNDGYLLQYFQQKGIPVLGIDPAANVAAVAQGKGIPTKVQFFGAAAAAELKAQDQQADLLLGNNVLAHVPDVKDFLAGIQQSLKPTGICTFEFPHLLSLIQENQFDTIYHEHFSYFSFLTVEKIFASFGLTLFDVEELPTHGGSLRIYGMHMDNPHQEISARVGALREKERQACLDRMETYHQFDEQVKITKRNLLKVLIALKEEGKHVIGYGAAAKGNTLLNYCGIGRDLLDYVVDRSPHKQGTLLPGSRIPVYHPDKIIQSQPDVVLILPWNLQEEISSAFSYIHQWGAQFMVPIPEVQVLYPLSVPG